MSSCSGAPPTTPTSAPSTETRCSPNSATSGRNLSDAELDLQPPAARPALPAVPPPPGPPARTPGGGAPEPHESRGNGATEVIGGRQQPTEFIARGSNPTTVMSAAPRHPGYGPLSAPDDVPYAPATTTTADEPPRSRPASGRSASTTGTRRRRASAPRPRRSGACARETPGAAGLLWILVLVIAALLAGGAGWFFGMGPGSPGTIPQLANKTVAEAQQLLRTAGFQSTTKDVFDDDVSPGPGGGLGACGRARSSGSSSRCPSPSPRAPSCSPCRS